MSRHGLVSLGSRPEISVTTKPGQGRPFACHDTALGIATSQEGCACHDGACAHDKTTARAAARMIARSARVIGCSA